MNKTKHWLIQRWITQKEILLTNTSAEKALHHKWLPALLFCFSLSILLFVFFCIFVATLGFFVNTSITHFTFIIAVGLTSSSLYLLMNLMVKKKALLYFPVVMLLAGSCLFFAIAITEQFYDLDYDSQWYHLETVIALNNGWNPVRHKLTVRSDPDISSQDILLSYPKAQEIVEAVIYRFTGKIEAGKSFNVMTILMAFGFTLSAFLKLKGLNPLLSLIGSLLLIANPITLIQYLSAYVDGSIYNLLLSLLALLLLFYVTHKNQLILAIILCTTILWVTKLTAILYVTVCFVTFLIYCWYNEKILLFFKSIQAYLIAAVLALLLLGFHPYVTNLIWYGNPLYAGGRSTNSYFYTNAPESLYYLHPIQRFIISIFSKPEILRGEHKTHQLKLPFTIASDELPHLINDNTVSGFGSLFSGIFILSIIGTLLMIKSTHRAFIKGGVLLFLAVLFVSSALFPASNYARFITPFWIFPSLVAIYSLSEKKVLPNALGIVLILVIIANNYLISREYVSYNVNGTKEVKAELTALKELSYRNVLAVDFDLFRSNRVRFQEAGIAFSEQSIKRCKSDKRRALARYIPEAKIMLCYQF